MLIRKPDVNNLLPMLCKLRFSKPFQSDDHVYCDLSNRTLDFIIYFHRNRFQTLKVCWTL